MISFRLLSSVAYTEHSTEIVIEANFEGFHEQLTELTPRNETDQQWLKTKLVDIAEGYVRNPVHQRSIITVDHVRELKNLRDQGVLILKPDKVSFHKKRTFRNLH